MKLDSQYLFDFNFIYSLIDIEFLKLNFFGYQILSLIFVMQFDFALALAKAVQPEKVNEVQRQYALHLQSSGQWKEAEKAFIKVNH